jgi:hypothetical protein
MNPDEERGLVSSATTVAARVRRRHWSASSVETAAEDAQAPQWLLSSAINDIDGVVETVVELVSAR